MKKIVLDARKINDYGIGEYIKSLFPAIIRSEGFDVKVIVMQNDEFAAKFFDSLPPSSLISVRSANYSMREHLEIPWILSKFNEFSYFSPHYIFPYFLRNKLIVTIHDLIHFKFPRHFKPGIRVELAKRFVRKIKRSSSKIFTVSENSKKDLIELFGFSENNISVIHNGLPDIFFKYKKGANPKPFPYIMYAGNFKPHKNLDVLFRAFRETIRDHPSIRLVLAGVDKSKELMKCTDKYRISDHVVPTGYIPIDQLINLLDFSEFFVFPSLYEGFGFPPLEAMSRKKAVISTNCGSLGEVLGNAPLYFDPSSQDDLSIKIDKLLSDQELRSRLEEKGYHHSSGFTTEKMISLYLKGLNDI